MTTLAAFPGTPSEYFSLMTAIGHHCACNYDVDSSGTRVVTGVCVAHRDLTSDPRVVAHLVFARRMAERFLLEEFGARR